MKADFVDQYIFTGKRSPAATASVVDGPWGKADTSSAGSPTVTTTADGLVMTLDSTNEAQNLCVYFGDILSYELDDLIFVEFWTKLSASLPAELSAAFGMCSARNDAIDSLAAHASFRAIGNNNIVVETDDGTNDVDDVATGLSLSTAFKKFRIDFKQGINTVSGGLSTGGKSNVLFSAENAGSRLQQVARNQRFNMEAYSAGLQPYLQLQKTAAASVGSLTVKRIHVGYRLST